MQNEIEWTYGETKNTWKHMNNEKQTRTICQNWTHEQNEQIKTESNINTIEKIFVTYNILRSLATLRKGSTSEGVISIWPKHLKEIILIKRQNLL